MRKIWLVPFLSAFTLARAASFDCTKAATPQEKAICATPDLSAADDQMVAAYHAWLTAAQPDWAAGIRDDQRVWLRTRATSCPAGNSANPIVPCLRGVYRERIGELQQKVKTIAGVTFVSRSITLTARDEPDSIPTWATEVTPGFGTLQASWPQVSSTVPQWTAWNNAIEMAAIQAASQGQQPAPHDWNGIVQPGVDQEVAVSVDRFDGQLVSATIFSFFDGHGAHPNHNSSEFYWMLDKQRELKAEDVFLPNSGWDAWMVQRLDRYLHRALDAQSNGDYRTWFSQGDAPKQLHSIVTNPEGWTMDPKGLTLVFQPYEVACYACTPEPLNIPWTDLKPYLQPAFTIPR
jgi:uncharacterized protein